MGGFFSAPSPPPPPPLPKVADPEEEKRKIRLETIDRNRRGRRGLIKTSSRGLLDSRASAPQRKTLLGE